MGNAANPAREARWAPPALLAYPVSAVLTALLGMSVRKGPLVRVARRGKKAPPASVASPGRAAMPVHMAR